jgi:hypothetical protein
MAGAVAEGILDLVKYSIKAYIKSSSSQIDNALSNSSAIYKYSRTF